MGNFVVFLLITTSQRISRLEGRKDKTKIRRTSILQDPSAILRTAEKTHKNFPIRRRALSSDGSGSVQRANVHCVRNAETDAPDWASLRGFKAGSKFSSDTERKRERERENR